MDADTLDKLPPWALALLDGQRVGHLGLLDADGEPRVMPVTYTRHRGAIWSIVDRKPKRQGRELARLRWLRRHPRAALTVDHYDEDWSALAWVQVLGVVTTRSVSEDPGAVAALTDRYRQYEADPPPGPLIRLEPVRILFWRAG